MYKIKTAYSCPPSRLKKYSKTYLMRIVKRLKLKRLSDFLSFKRGSKIYEAIRYHFGSVSNCWEEIDRQVLS
jgi:hypothetical protein